MNQAITKDLSIALKNAHLKYFSPKSAPQVWGIIVRINEKSPVGLISKTRQKLSSVRNSTDRYESGAATQALRVMDVFENWLMKHETEAYEQLQRVH